MEITLLEYLQCYGDVLKKIKKISNVMAAMRFDTTYFDNFSASEHDDNLRTVHALYEKLCDRLVFAEEGCVPDEIGSDDQDTCCKI